MIDMNIFLLVIIFLLLAICIILLYILFNRIKQPKEVKPKEIYKIDEISIWEIQVPKKIENMEHHILFQSCLKVFEVFKALKYPSKDERILDNIEWHSWQVSLLLTLLKTDKSFFIPNPQNNFHKVLLNKPISYIDTQMQKILNKYQNSVNINSSRDILSKDIIWSAKEVSIIFLYMINSSSFEGAKNS